LTNAQNYDKLQLSKIVVRGYMKKQKQQQIKQSAQRISPEIKRLRTELSRSTVKKNSHDILMEMRYGA